MTPEEIEKNVFEIVDQLDRGILLIDSLEEREREAEMHLAAGLRAKASTAYKLGADILCHRSDAAF